MIKQAIGGNLLSPGMDSRIEHLWQGASSINHKAAPNSVDPVSFTVLCRGIERVLIF